MQHWMVTKSFIISMGIDNVEYTIVIRCVYKLAFIICIWPNIKYT